MLRAVKKLFKSNYLFTLGVIICLAWILAAVFAPLIAPYDPSALKEIEKALQKSDLGINPSNDGKVIRLVFPELTEERRRDLVKVVKKKGEEAKVAIRSIRRDANETIKKQKKNGDITEDDQKIMEEDAQKATDASIKDIDKIIADKEKEIMEV